jgi:hypothetical protein
MGQAGGWAMFGPPAQGQLQLLAQEVSLPALPAAEQAAMLDLKKALAIPDDIWEGGNSHPCTW